MRPAIGITCDYDLGISSQSISPGRSYFFSNKNYAQAVEKSGGLPLLLPCLSSEEIVEAFLDKIDGLLLSGGVDIDPSYYREEPDPRLGGLNPERAAFEVMIIQRALERDLPLLGICGGYQLLNVVAEGSLYQDIYSQVPQVLNHRQRAPRWYPYHTVQIEKESKLRQILRIDSLRVNSRHHQAVKNLGKDFKVSASTSDNIIEAIESTVHRFVIGVQWHPEDMFERDAHARSLFQALIKAAQG